MPSERLTIDRILPTKYHVEIDYGPPSYESRIVVYDVNLGSDEEARRLAAVMLNEQNIYPCAEVWDRTRLVCSERKDG